MQPSQTCQRPQVGHPVRAEKTTNAGQVTFSCSYSVSLVRMRNLADMPISWWEKTVEYKAVLEWYGDGVGLAPLDGVHEEKAGDLIRSENSLLLLIEFKRDQRAIKSEIPKFRGKFNEASNDLKSRDWHHLLVYGEDQRGKLILKCQTYFSRRSVDFARIPEWRGVCKECFDRYLAELAGWKNVPSESGGSGNNGGPDFSSVSIVARADNKACVTSYSEYAEKFLAPDHPCKPRPPISELEVSPSGPTPG